MDHEAHNPKLEQYARGPRRQALRRQAKFKPCDFAMLRFEYSMPKSCNWIVLVIYLL